MPLTNNELEHRLNRLSKSKIPLSRLEDGDQIGDVLTWDGDEWVSAPPATDTTGPRLSEYALDIQSDVNGRFAVVPEDLTGRIAMLQLWVDNALAFAGCVRNTSQFTFYFGLGTFTAAKAVVSSSSLLP